MDKPIAFQRISWIDQWRGLAVFLMIIYHIAFDLDYLELYAIDQDSLFWFIEGNFVRLSFLLIVGISLYLSHKNHQTKNLTFHNYFRRHLKRAMAVFLIAMVLTLVTWLLFPEEYIRFGILHLISVGIFFGALLVRRPILAFFLGLITFYLGVTFSLIQLETPYLLVFGVIYPQFTTLDYFPIFPWMGFVFFGIALAHLLDRQKLLAPAKIGPSLKSLSFFGQHALLIYVIHQPILFGGLWLLTYFR